MLEGSATIKMTISAGRRRIFRLLIAIALIRKFFEAPLLAEGGLVYQQQSSGQHFYFFERTSCAKKSVLERSNCSKKRRYLIKDCAYLTRRSWTYAEKTRHRAGLQALAEYSEFHDDNSVVHHAGLTAYRT